MQVDTGYYLYVTSNDAGQTIKYTKMNDQKTLILKTSLLSLFLIIVSTQGSFAQHSAAEQEVVNLSKDKWQWMADKNVDKLAILFDDRSKFVHMSGSWKKERELANH